MIPVAIVIGFVAGLAVGRPGWWATGILAVAWPVLLIATDVGSGVGFFLSAAVVAALNTIVGVAAGMAGRRLMTPIASGRARP